MAKEILFNIDARDQLKKGVDALANAVKVTLGRKDVTLSSKRNSVLRTSQKTG